MRGAEDFFGVGRIRHEAALNEDARHVEFAKDQELSATNAAVFEIGFLQNGFMDLMGKEYVERIVAIAGRPWTW